MISFFSPGVLQYCVPDLWHSTSWILRISRKESPNCEPSSKKCVWFSSLSGCTDRTYGFRGRFGCKWLNKLSCAEVCCVINHMQYRCSFNLHKLNEYFGIESGILSFHGDTVSSKFSLYLLARLTGWWEIFRFFKGPRGYSLCSRCFHQIIYSLVADRWANCLWSFRSYAMV